MLDFYTIAKDNYLAGLYTEEQLDVFVEKGKITKKQKKEIVAAKNEVNHE